MGLSIEPLAVWLVYRFTLLPSSAFVPEYNFFALSYAMFLKYSFLLQHHSLLRISV